MGSPVWAYRRANAYADHVDIRHRRHVKRGLTCTCPRYSPLKESEPVKNTLIALTVAAVLALTGCANDNAQEAVGNTAAKATPAPAVTVTAPAKPAPTVTVTEKTSSVSVPQACLDALDNADEGFGYASTGFSAAGKAFTAVGDGDAALFASQVLILQGMQPKLTALAPTYNENKAACRAAGGN